MSLLEVTKDKNFIIGCIVITVLACIVIWIFPSLDKEYILVFFAAVGWLCEQSYLKRKELAQKHFEKKSDVYQRFAEGFVGLGLVEEPERSRRITNAILEFQKTVLIWGNAQMIKDYLQFQQLLASNQATPHKAIDTMDFMLKMTRKDLGHNDILLDKYDLARFVINDVDKVLGEKNDSSQ